MSVSKVDSCINLVEVSPLEENTVRLKIESLIKEILGKKTQVEEKKHQFKNEASRHTTFMRLVMCKVREKMQEGGLSADKAVELILDSLLSLPEREKNEKILKQCLSAYNWNDPLFQTENCARYALIGIYDGVLTEEEATQVFFYRSLRKKHLQQDIEAVPLFEKSGKVNLRARLIIQETLKPIRDCSNFANIADENIPDSYLTEKQIDQWFDEMQKKPSAQQQFFVIKDIQKNGSKAATDSIEILKEILNSERTITQELRNSVGINVFCRFLEEGKDLRMVPSLTMMQTFLNVKFGLNAVTIFPVIGEAPLGLMIKAGYIHFRVFGLPDPDPDRHLPQQADYLTSLEEEDYYYHDFYHAIAVSYIPPAFRPGFLKFAECVQAIKPSYVGVTKAEEFLNELFLTLVDLEQFLYREVNEFEQKKYSPAENFWKSISMSVTTALIRVSLRKALDNNLNYQEMGEECNAYSVAIVQHKIWESLFQEVLKIRTELKAMCGVRLKDLAVVANAVSILMKENATLLLDLCKADMDENTYTNTLKKVKKEIDESQILISFQTLYENYRLTKISKK